MATVEAMEELKRDMTATHVKLGSLENGMVEALKVEEKGELQKAAMNVVIDQACDEFGKIQTGQAALAEEAKREFQNQRDETAAQKDEMTMLKRDYENIGNDVRQESQGIKSVVTNVSASHGQELGAIKQRVEQIEKMLENKGRGGNTDAKGGEKMMGFIPVKEMKPKVYGGRIEEWRNWKDDMEDYGDTVKPG